MAALILDAMREGYSIDQIKRTMTAGEMIAFLSSFGEDTPVYLSHDRGYTYGGILESRFEEREDNEEDDE